MAQHFLLSAASRTLSLRSIYKAGEDAAYDVFCQMRWPETDGEAICPVCSHHETYKITTRRKFKCKNYHHQFRVTSGPLRAICPVLHTSLSGGHHSGHVDATQGQQGYDVRQPFTASLNSVLA